MTNKKTNNPWIGLINSSELESDQTPTIFCFPHSGGGSSIYSGWKNSCPPGIKICSVVLPGRDGRLEEPLYSDMDNLISDLLPAVSPYFNRPYVFFGHSFGSFVAFALTKALLSEGYQNPQHLFVSASRAPHIGEQEPLVHLMSDSDLTAALSALDGLPTAFLSSPELLKLFLPVIRADLSISETYLTKQERIPISITAFGSEEDPRVSVQNLRLWEEMTSEEFNCGMFSGGHFYLKHHETHIVERVATLIKQS